MPAVDRWAVDASDALATLNTSEQTLKMRSPVDSWALASIIWTVRLWAAVIAARVCGPEEEVSPSGRSPSPPS